MFVSKRVYVPVRLVSLLICVGMFEEYVYMNWVMIDFFSVSYCLAKSLRYECIVYVIVGV